MRLADFVRKRLDVSLLFQRPESAVLDDKAMPASDLIPYLAHYDDETIQTKEGGLVQVIELDGLYFESLSPREIKRFERERNTALRAIAASNRVIYVYVVRRQINIYPAGEGSTWFSRYFNAAWRRRLETRPLFVNKIVIAVVENEFQRGAPGFIQRFASALTKIDTRAQAQREMERLDKQAERLNEAVNTLLGSLSAYGARKMRIQRYPQFQSDLVSAEEAKAAVLRFKLDWPTFQGLHGAYPAYQRDDVLDFLGPELSEPASFFYYLVNLQDERVPVSELSLDKALARSWIDGPRLRLGNMMVVDNVSGTRAASVLSMVEWPARSPSHALDEFLKKPVEFIITQSFAFTDRVNETQMLRIKRDRMEVNDAKGDLNEDVKELSQGISALARGKVVHGIHHLSLLVHVPAVTNTGNADEDRRQTVAGLNEAVDTMKPAFLGLNVKPVRENLGVETFFWSQLAGQRSLLARKGKIKSSNFAGFASLHNFAMGMIDGNLWGPAIYMFETESQTPYLFSYHRNLEGMVAGHIVIVGDTGSGKTALKSALIAMADKVSPRVFWFDNREGARVFMAAMGAQHTMLTPVGTTGWNPCQLPDTEENRAYLLDLLKLMRTCYGGQLKPDDVERFKQAVQENYQLELKDRRLRNVAWCFGHNELGRDMRVWHGADGNIGANSGVFDNETDNIDLSVCRYHCFEMRQLIQNGTARAELPVVLSYPLHRIEQSMNGQPFLIVLDEGQNLVRHEYWREKIDAYIMQIRRKNGLLAFLTPDVKYLFCYTDSLLKQAATQVHFTSSSAVKSDYVDGAGLTESEYRFLHDTPTWKRMLLLRRGHESIKVKFDLSDIAEFIPVLSSNDKGVALMHEVIKELGSDDPERWVPIFMRRSIEQNTHNLNLKRA